MKYTEFRNAAERHLQTCQRLKDLLEGNLGKREKENLLKNLFYLTGYVVECSFKFAFWAAVYKKFSSTSSQSEYINQISSYYQSEFSGSKEVEKSHFNFFKDGNFKQDSTDVVIEVLKFLQQYGASDFYKKSQIYNHIVSNITNITDNLNIQTLTFLSWYSEIRYYVPKMQHFQVIGEANLQEKYLAWSQKDIIFDYFREANHIYLQSMQFVDNLPNSKQRR